MKEIKLMLEYGCYPVWIYQNGCATMGEAELERIEKTPGFAHFLEELQREYQSLFIDNRIVFEYRGFNTEADKEAFIKRVDQAYLQLKAEFGDNYIVTYCVNADEL